MVCVEQAEYHHIEGVLFVGVVVGVAGLGGLEVVVVWYGVACYVVCSVGMGRQNLVVPSLYDRGMSEGSRA